MDKSIHAQTEARFTRAFLSIHQNLRVRFHAELLCKERKQQNRVNCMRDENAF